MISAGKSLLCYTENRRLLSEKWLTQSLIIAITFYEIGTMVKMLRRVYNKNIGGIFKFRKGAVIPREMKKMTLNPEISSLTLNFRLHCANLVTDKSKAEWMNLNEYVLLVAWRYGCRHLQLSKYVKETVTFFRINLTKEVLSTLKYRWAQSFKVTLREVSFFTRRGAPENWGDQVLCLRSKGGSKDFFKLKRGFTYIF